MRALLCLVVAVSLQIGVNYANDYSDGIRGTDEHRVGPPRLVGSGRARPRAVLTVALVFFGLAAVAGLAHRRARSTGGCSPSAPSCIAAAWFYTGGKRPYGYSAFGEVFAFLFFGVVATRRHDVRAGPAPSTSRPGSGASRRARSPPPCCSSTTCAIARRTRSSASAPSPC